MFVDFRCALEGARTDIAAPGEIQPVTIMPRVRHLLCRPLLTPSRRPLLTKI